MASRKKCVMWALHSEAPLVCEKDGLMEKKLQLYNMFWLLHGLTHWFLSRCSGEDRILQRPPCSPSRPSHQIQRKSSGALISTSFADAEDSSAESELSLQPTHRESCCPWTAKFPNAPVMSEMCRRAGKHRVGNIKIDKKINEAETHREEKRGWTRLISAQTSSVHDYRDVCNYVSVNNETETPVSQALKIDPEHLTWLQHIRTLWMFWMFRMIWDHFGS